MALKTKSLFLYGYQITERNSSLDFKVALGGPEKRATLTIGYYSLTSLCKEIKRAFESVDGLNSYTVTADRTVGGGIENRITITTTGSYLDLLFATGSRKDSTIAPLIGFNATDYSGATSYTGSNSSGFSLLTHMEGYNFLPPELYRHQQGSVNVSGSGVKESVVFNTMYFWQVQFKYIPYITAISEWTPLLTWLSLQRLVEFTPEISNPTTFYEGTLESSSEDSKGLGFRIVEMLPNFPELYDTGMLKFRLNK